MKKEKEWFQRWPNFLLFTHLLDITLSGFFFNLTESVNPKSEKEDYYLAVTLLQSLRTTIIWRDWRRRELFFKGRKELPIVHFPVVFLCYGRIQSKIQENKSKLETESGL